MTLITACNEVKVSAHHLNRRSTSVVSAPAHARTDALRPGWLRQPAISSIRTSSSPHSYRPRLPRPFSHDVPLHEVRQADQDGPDSTVNQLTVLP